MVLLQPLGLPWRRSTSKQRLAVGHQPWRLATLWRSGSHGCTPAGPHCLRYTSGISIHSSKGSGRPHRRPKPDGAPELRMGHGLWRHLPHAQLGWYTPISSTLFYPVHHSWQRSSSSYFLHRHFNITRPRVPLSASQCSTLPWPKVTRRRHSLTLVPSYLPRRALPSTTPTRTGVSPALSST
jgi:hypothetical protein